MKRRREERLLSDYKGEKSEQFNSFSKKTGRVKVGLDRDLNTLGHQPKFLHDICCFLESDISRCYLLGILQEDLELSTHPEEACSQVFRPCDFSLG